MHPGLDLRDICQKISLILIVHMIIPITLKMLDWLSTHRQVILLGTVSFFAAYIGMRVAYLSLLFVGADILALGQVTNPLGFVLTDPHVVVLVDVLVQFEGGGECEEKGEHG